MQSENNRAFKEWAVVCAALREGRQILLIRKGGIREDAGVFRINDPEFFLLPTYEHQKAGLLQEEYGDRLEAIEAAAPDLQQIVIDTYAVVDTILVARDEDQVNAVSDAFVWNEAYVKMRFDFNPYDPLYLILLRVYLLPEAVTLPMQLDYAGCKSWVTLEHSLSTAGARSALSDAEFLHRREAVLAALR